MNKRTRNVVERQPAIDISHHERRCTICHHPEREAIEEAFLQWRKVSNLQFEFKLPDRTSLYRHAHAFGLFAQRSRNLRFALEHIIEESEAINPSAQGIVSAVRAYTRLTDDGQWIEPPAQLIISSGTRTISDSPKHAALPARQSAPEALPLIATAVETENPSTR